MSKFHEEFFGNKTPEHDNLMVWLHKNLDNIIKKIPFEEEINWGQLETEVLCKSGNKFIIGYADAVLTYSGGSFYAVGNRIIFEIKPKIDSWGGPLRQLKTYMDILQTEQVERDFSLRIKKYDTQGILITYTELDEDVKNIFKKENIDVITVKKV